MEPIERLQNINTRKRGNKFGFWFFKALLKLFGLRKTYGFLYIVCLYYLVFDRTAVSAALSYINKRFPDCGYLIRLLHVYRLFISQGKQLIDRYASVSGHTTFDIQLNGYNELIGLLRNNKQGIILLTSHIGSWQIALTTLKKIGRTVYLLMRAEDNIAVQSSLNIDREQDDIKIISPEQYLGGIVEIMDVLKKGHIVSIMGDRRYGAKSVGVKFLGKKAWFPFSGFAVAAAVKSPVVVLLSNKISAYKYIVDVSNVIYPRYDGKYNKQQQLYRWVQNYVEIIEVFVKKYPYQCFLFHDVWSG
ncbi:MAG: lysophospholipid acyltransferase family protein [Deltaproteobacteria bacterium]|nr:lysophospholipid acyltransferase family protein [Deltaproteobacteria bacterium]